MAAAVAQLAWMAWEEAGACRCTWRSIFEFWVVSILLRPSVFFFFCSLWWWIWEESDSLLVHLYSEPQHWNQYYISCNSWVEGSAIDLKSWRLSTSPTSNACKYPPDIWFTSETVEHKPCMAWGPATPLFIMLKELWWNWFLNINWKMFFFSCLAISQNTYFNFHYCRCCSSLYWSVFDFSYVWLINIHICIVSALCTLICLMKRGQNKEF